jgi:hypothetical protein
MCVHLLHLPYGVHVKGANWVSVGVQLKIKNHVLLLNLANGDIIVSSIINGVTINLIVILHLYQIWI